MSKRILMSASERAELVLRLLRREATAGQLARETEERDILAKATAWFATETTKTRRRPKSLET